MQVRTVDVGGVSVCYRESGDPAGTPVVLLHGGASDGSTWDAFAPVLVRAGHRVIAPDLRGHGQSARTGAYPLSAFADDLIGLLDVLGLERVKVIGHSLGAHAAALAAQRHPERFTDLVLEDPPAPVRTRRARNLPPVRAFLLIGLGSLFRKRRFHRRAVTQVMMQLRAPDPGYWAKLPAITARTLVISGGPTSHVSPRDVADIARIIPRAELATIPVGHRVHSLAPEHFRRVVLPFLAT